MQYRQFKTRIQPRVLVSEKASPLRACLSLLRRRFTRLPRATALAVILLAVVLSPLAIAAPATAVAKYDELSPSQQADSLIYYRALRNCIERGYWKNSVGEGTVIANNDMGAQDANAFTWFYKIRNFFSDAEDPLRADVSNRTRLGTHGDLSNQGWGKCDDGSWIGKAVLLWGYSSGADFLCNALGFTREVPVDDCTNPGSSDANNFVAPMDPNFMARKLDDLYFKTLAPGVRSDQDLPGEAQYKLVHSAFITFCAAPGGSVYSVWEFPGSPSADAKPVKVDYTYRDRDTNENTLVSLYNTGPDTTGTKRFCRELAAMIDDPSDALVKAYLAWARDPANQGRTDDDGAGGSCTDGRDPDANGVCPDGSTVTSCAIENVGWILCPVLYAGAELADGAYDFLAGSFLETNVALVNTDPDAIDPETGNKLGTGAYDAWRIMQGLANVAFIIVFLIMIFSQLSSTGISNYGVKKLLPRLILGAVLVNVSFLICQLAVDVSNIAGYSLKGLLEGVANQVATSGGGTRPGVGDESGNLAGIATLVLATTAFAWVNASTLIVAVVGAVISLLMILVLLIVRQVLIVLLIVVAPLAFVAFLLPNTQPLFEKWRKMFTALLLLFPIIGLIYGASLLASAILLQVAGDNVPMQIAAYAALVLPLVAVIPILKGSLDGVGKLGGAIQSWGQKARSGAQGGTKAGMAAYNNSGLGKFKAGQRGDRKARIAAGTFRGSNRNPLNWGRNARARANAAMNSSGVFNTITSGYGADRELAAEAQNRKDQAEAIAMFGGDDALTIAWAQSGGDDKHAAFAGLNTAQQAQFSKMRDAGHHRKATSHLAAAQYLSENGKGDAATVSSALARAKTAGANETVVNGATQAAIAAYRKSGRGDAVADLSTAAGSPMTQQQGWGQVAAGAVHRDGIDVVKNAAGRASFEAHLGADAENTRKALAGYDSMESRAQASAQSVIVTAAQLHQFNATGTTPTISNIQDAKAYFNVR